MPLASRASPAAVPEIYREKAFVDAGFQPAKRLPTAAMLGETSLAFLVDPCQDAVVDAAGRRCRLRPSCEMQRGNGTPEVERPQAVAANSSSVGRGPRTMHATVLVSSAGRRVGLIECFRRSASAAGIDLDVLACDMEPELSAACYAADRAFAVPRCDSPAFIDSMLEDRDRCRRRSDRADDRSGTCPARGRRRIVSRRPERAFMSARSSVIEVVRDKVRTAEVLAAAGVPVPWTVSA